MKNKKVPIIVLLCVVIFNAVMLWRSINKQNLGEDLLNKRQQRFDIVIRINEGNLTENQLKEIEIELDKLDDEIKNLEKRYN